MFLPEVGGCLVYVVLEPLSDFRTILGNLMDEAMRGTHVAVQEVYEVLDTWWLAILLGLGYLDHVVHEGLEVCDGCAEINCLVDLSDHGLVSRYTVAYSLGEVIRAVMTEDVDDLVSVSDGQA